MASINNSSSFKQLGWKQSVWWTDIGLQKTFDSKMNPNNDYVVAMHEVCPL